MQGNGGGHLVSLARVGKSEGNIMSMKEDVVCDNSFEAVLCISSFYQHHDKHNILDHSTIFFVDVSTIRRP